MSESPPLRGLPTWGFASPGRVRDWLTGLALAGTKTTTAGLLVEFELDGDTVPEPGERSALLDSGGRPVAVVETVACHVVRLADVDDQHAIDEGEGYANAAEFRDAHVRFWNGYIDQIRDRLGDASFALTDDTQVVAERFRVVEVLGPDRASGIIVRPADPADRAAVDAFLLEHDADLVARLGELVDARRHPALIAEVRGSLAGVTTWIASDSSLEILTLHAAERWHGAGTALIAASRTVARATGCERLWLITTNDNLEALRFYQRRGLRLVRLHAGAVDRSRTMLKPDIPDMGVHGIPIRDELELEMDIGDL